ncbi:unnamed protein product [Ambrosiozyma monospora]|uniref:Unnamed protein product n=1 Tax=Ambrosiozyma monospora TaxID=43982 RepID=A0ACB5U1W0_AMBMO|nr:unnamed protein product [Ambrosiozyma monospora]
MWIREFSFLQKADLVLNVARLHLNKDKTKIQQINGGSLEGPEYVLKNYVWIPYTKDNSEYDDSFDLLLENEGDDTPRLACF